MKEQKLFRGAEIVTSLQIITVKFLYYLDHFNLNSNDMSSFFFNWLPKYYSSTKRKENDTVLNCL